MKNYFNEDRTRHSWCPNMKQEAGVNPGLSMFKQRHGNHLTDLPNGVGRPLLMNSRMATDFS